MSIDGTRPTPVIELIEWARERDRAARSALSPLLVRAYGVGSLRRVAVRLARRLEGGAFFSRTLREILARYHRVKVGMYSYGSCMIPGNFPPGTVVGNYCSTARSIRIYRRNHPIDRISQHPFFYNSDLGLLDNDSIETDVDNPLRIGNDVWIGDQVVILPRCRTIGDGAVVGAGSVVTRDVEPFTVIAGNPARLLRKRFGEPLEAQVRSSHWWDLAISELAKDLPAFLAPATSEVLEKVANGQLSPS
ncbi:MAG: CatB-related O-acetyltransferase [Planctomycetota bacterium]